MVEDVLAELIYIFLMVTNRLRFFLTTFHMTACSSFLNIQLR